MGGAAAFLVSTEARGFPGDLLNGSPIQPAASQLVEIAVVPLSLGNIQGSALMVCDRNQKYTTAEPWRRWARQSPRRRTSLVDRRDFSRQPPATIVPVALKG